ncbi:hypothetical protein SAMD00023353_0901030 [Rosellinia necatrix]|uniref:Uncharacterized protein n=1 Tax=Rosellinia necatrix TaxID=77044 RepID=A0A1S8A6P1_ROSNE|nr:hypothetical protein SAMD00023353_0901030 [Rosellinia necatrix]
MGQGIEAMSCDTNGHGAYSGLAVIWFNKDDSTEHRLARVHHTTLQPAPPSISEL